MSENALVQLTPQPTAIQQGGLGLEGFQIKPANMKLVQRTTTGEGVIPGKLLDDLSGAHFDSVQVVPLAIKLGRVLFPPDGELGAEPICRSDDGIVPSPNAAVPQSPKCGTCDRGPKMWANYKNSGKKPDCQEKYRLLFVLRDTGLPYFLTVSGKSITNLKKLKDAIFRDVISARAKGQNLSLFDYTFEIKPTFIQGKKGAYYVLNFQNLAKIANPGEFGTHFAEFVMRQKAHEAEATEAEYVDSEVAGESTSQYETP